MPRRLLFLSFAILLEVSHRDVEAFSLLMDGSRSSSGAGGIGRYPQIPTNSPRRGGPLARTTTDRTTNTTSPSFSNRGRLRVPSLKEQLDYARYGHVALRTRLDPLQLAILRQELLRHAKGLELAAYRQKVQVASHSNQLATSVRTVKECCEQLEKLGVPWDSLPFLQYFNTWRNGVPSVYSLASLLAETASCLMDVSTPIRLYQDSLFWKRKGDGPTPWHSDARMAPFDTSNFITFWIPLQDIPSQEEGGTGLVYCSKSHADFALPYWSPYPTTHEDPRSQWNQLETRYGGTAVPGVRKKDVVVDPNFCVHHMPLSLGDITAHAGWTLHSANDNTGVKHRKQHPAQSNADRLALAISFVDAKAIVRPQVKKDWGDDEDISSYRDWIDQVPVNKPYFQHDFVPIVWPNKQ